MLKKVIAEWIIPLGVILFIFMVGLACESLAWIWNHVLGV